MAGTKPEASWSAGIANRVGAASALILIVVVSWQAAQFVVTPGALAVFVGWMISVAIVSAQFILSLFARPFTADANQSADLRRRRVAVLVPCYNEEAALLEASLRSMIGQTRSPDAICIVDDGSTVDYRGVEQTIRADAEAHGIRLHWRRTKNHGKRYALINAARQEPDADIYMTVDSDSILDRRAIEEGLKPFADPRVQSVAGFLLVLNYAESWLARMMELVVVTWGQLERSALSLTGSVLVNSGACAFYRAEVIRENAADFLSETIFGKQMSFSDDSLLTLFALERGRTVQQPTCFAFSNMPTTLRAHLTQQTRWMRGAIVRAWWRFKYLRVGSFAYWVLVLKWTQFLANTLLSVLFVVLILTVAPGGAVLFGVGWLAIQCVITARYLALRRSDQSAAQRWSVYGLAPLVVIWQALVFHPIRLYAYTTFARTGWGTRKQTGTESSGVVTAEAGQVIQPNAIASP